MNISRQIAYSIALVMMLFFNACTKDRPTFAVEYEVRVTCLWSVDSHPADYPQTAELAPFEVFSHKLGTEAFTVGLLCSEGIRQMAEVGNLITLQEEIDLFRAGDRALDRDMGQSITFLRTSSVRLGFSETHHLFTLMAKISPSPDWFIAAQGVELYNGSSWIDSMDVYPEAYDAGTDRGQTFVAANIPAQPREAVQIIRSQPLADNGVVAPLARITLVRVK